MSRFSTVGRGSVLPKGHLTRHGLIRSTLPVVLKSASRLHPMDENGGEVGATDFPHWRYQPGAATDKTVRWSSRLAGGSVVIWSLEVEQGANGVLAHLSAVPVAGPMTRLPRGLCRVALRARTGAELAGLVRALEPSTEA